MKKTLHKALFPLEIFFFFVIISSCTPLIDDGFQNSRESADNHSPPNGSTSTGQPEIFPQPATLTPSPTLTSTLIPSKTITNTLIPTETQTPTKSLTPTITHTSTDSVPSVVVNIQAAHCRYGPSKAYLHAADLYQGDRGRIHGRFQYSDWLYIKWDKLAYRCWVSPYVVDVSGDISGILFHSIGLERIPSTLYPPPKNVRASREGDMVTITWDRVPMTEDDDRGYLIEAFICQNGSYFWWTASTESQFITSYTVRDEAGCRTASSGKIYTVEKHGYTDPVSIPWPKP